MLLDLPANKGLKATHFFEECNSEEIRQDFEICLGEPVLLLKKLHSQKPLPEGHYYVESTKQSFFIKVSKRKFSPKLIAANDIALFLRAKSINVSTFDPSQYPKAYKENFDIYVYDYISGELLPKTSQTAQQLGINLNKLHISLSQIPNEIYSAIKLSSDEKLNTCEAVLKKIRNKEVSLVGLKSKALKKIPKWFRSFYFEGLESQPLHGDLNHGNILKDHSQNSIVFLDFEDTTCAFFPHIIEVAFVIERFLLAENKEETKGLSIELLRRYLDGRSIDEIIIDEDTLYKAFVWLSVRSICLLTLLESEGSWPDSEWEKFIHLLDLHEKNKLLYRQIIVEVKKRVGS